jgi:FkbM family methyltransferase
LARFTDGTELFVLEGDPRAQDLLASNGTINPLSLDIWRALCATSNWTIVIDVGANYGEMLLGAALPPGARAFAFEPAPRVAQCLRRSVSAAGASIEVVEQAVGAESGTTALFEDFAWSGTTTTTASQAKDGSRERTVPVTRLDTFLEARGVRPDERYLLKVDVEGGERQVLEGFLPLLDLGTTARLLVEIIHASDADRAWMIEHFYLHLISKDTLVPVPVNSVRDYHRLCSSGRFYELDGLLSTEILTAGFVPITTAAPGTEGAATRDEEIVRAENAAMAVISQREMAVASETAVAGIRDGELDTVTKELTHAHEVVRALSEERAALLASHSWRMTAPLRAVTDRIRRLLRR